jgi:hypothetical protein
VTAETKRRVPRNQSGVPICTIETLSDLPLQVSQNDRPFSEQTFPYLAAPWFYPRAKDEGTYYWPSSARREMPE